MHSPKRLARIRPKPQGLGVWIGVTYLFLIAMSLVNIGSSVAFKAVLSLGVILLMAIYGTPISCAFSDVSP